MESDRDRYVDTREAARITGLSPHTLSTLRCRGGGPLYRRVLGRAVRYAVADLHAWLERHPAQRSTSEGAAA